MKDYMKDFDLPQHPSTSALQKWRDAVSIVKNPRRRFRHVADLAKRSIHQNRFNKIKGDLRVSFTTVRAAMRFIDGGHAAAHPQNTHEHPQARDVKPSEFRNNPEKLASMVRNYDVKTLRSLNGVDGVAEAVDVSIKEGVKSSDLSTRQETYGVNKYTEKPSKSFFMFVWDALHDLTLMILIVCAIVSIGVGLATEGFSDGIYHWLRILLSILLVVTVTAVSDYKQSLQFKHYVDKEKKMISTHVTRDSCRKKVSIYDLVVGDVVHLSIGDQVPADGIFIAGYNLLIDDSSLTGDINYVHIDEKKPFLLAGTKVQDGSAIMLVTAVGMKTEWGKLMETLSEEGEDETPLQAKLNGVATIIGKIGFVFAVLTFLELTVRFIVEKAMRNEFSSWGSSDAMTMLVYFATAVTIIVVTVPEGLPLAVTLSLAFAMKKLMADKALVRQLSACETMGLAGTEVAKEQADVIVMDGNFATIEKVAKWGRAVYINIQKFVLNIVALMINFVSACITGSAPLTAVQLFWVNLIMDTLGALALALATEPPNEGLMKRPPVKCTNSFVTRAMWKNIVGQSVYQMVVIFVLNFAGKPILNLHGSNATAILNTFIFNTFVFCQVFNEINSCYIDKIYIFRGMFSSWIFMAVMIATVVFQVLIVEFLGTFASTVPLDWQLWVLSIVIGLVSMLIAVVLKCIPV